MKRELAWVYKQRRNGLMVWTIFIGLHPSGINNSQCRNDYLEFHRFSSVLEKHALLTGKMITEFLGFHQKEDNYAD